MPFSLSARAVLIQSIGNFFTFLLEELSHCIPFQVTWGLIGIIVRTVASPSNAKLISLAFVRYNLIDDMPFRLFILILGDLVSFSIVTNLVFFRSFL